MKRLSLTFLLAAAAAVAAEEPDDAAKGVFRSVESGWKANDQDAVSDHFDEKVSLSFGPKPGSYGKDQGATYLKKYFADNPTSTLKIKKDGYSGGDNPSARYDYTYTNASGVKVTASLIVSLGKNKDGDWVIRSITVAG